MVKYIPRFFIWSYVPMQEIVPEERVMADNTRNNGDEVRYGNEDEHLDVNNYLLM